MPYQIICIMNMRHGSTVWHGRLLRILFGPSYSIFSISAPKMESFCLRFCLFLFGPGVTERIGVAAHCHTTPTRRPCHTSPYLADCQPKTATTAGVHCDRARMPESKEFAPSWKLPDGIEDDLTMGECVLYAVLPLVTTMPCNSMRVDCCRVGLLLLLTWNQAYQQPCR
jgi:hypothetical protein